MPTVVAFLYLPRLYLQPPPPKMRSLFHRLLGSGMEVGTGALSHVIPITFPATPRPTFHSPYKLLRHDALSVLSLKPLEIPHPKPGNNPGAEQAD